LGFGYTLHPILTASGDGGHDLHHERALFDLNTFDGFIRPSAMHPIQDFFSKTQDDRAHRLAAFNTYDTNYSSPLCAEQHLMDHLLSIGSGFY
jgi:hypothetical protein